MDSLEIYLERRIEASVVCERTKTADEESSGNPSSSLLWLLLLFSFSRILSLFCLGFAFPSVLPPPCCAAPQTKLPCLTKLSPFSSRLSLVLPRFFRLSLQPSKLSLFSFFCCLLNLPDDPSLLLLFALGSLSFTPVASFSSFFSHSIAPQA